MTEFQAMDIVLYSEDTMYGLCQRIRSYGIKGALKKGLGVRLGIVVKLFDIKYVAEFGKKVKITPLREIEGQIVKTFRNMYLSNIKNEFTITKTILAMHSEEVVDIQRVYNELGKKNPSCAAVLLLTANYIDYAPGVTDSVDKVRDFLNHAPNFMEV